jgi:hypothetical protein
MEEKALVVRAVNAAIDLTELEHLGSLSECRNAMGKLNVLMMGYKLGVGIILCALQEKRLYLEAYDTLEQCADVEFGLTRPRAYQYIEYAKGFKGLSKILDKKELNDLSESSIRELSKKENPVEVLEEAKRNSRNGKVTASAIKTAAKEMEDEELDEEDEEDEEEIETTSTPSHFESEEEEEEEHEYTSEEEFEEEDEEAEIKTNELFAQKPESSPSKSKSSSKSKNKSFSHKPKSGNHSSSLIRQAIHNYYEKGIPCGACGMFDPQLDRHIEGVITELHRLEQTQSTRGRK